MMLYFINAQEGGHLGISGGWTRYYKGANTAIAELEAGYRFCLHMATKKSNDSKVIFIDPSLVVTFGKYYIPVNVLTKIGTKVNQYSFFGISGIGIVNSHVDLSIGVGGDYNIPQYSYLSLNMKYLWGRCNGNRITAGVSFHITSYLNKNH